MHESDVKNVTQNISGEAFLQAAIIVNGLVLFPIICVVGLTGNMITIIVLSRKAMRTTTNVYLCALAVSDAVKLLTDMLYPLVIMVKRHNPDAGSIAYAYLYPYAHFVFQMSACVSAWLILSVAVERYIMVCHPTRARALCTMPRAKLVTALVFITMTLLAIPTALRYKTVRNFDASTNRTELGVGVTTLWQNTSFVTGYNWFQILLRSLIPLLSLFFLNVLIIRSLRKTRANRRNARRNKITVMLIVVILLFLTCNIPDAVMSTVFKLGYHEAGNVAKGAREFTDMLLALNAALNFVIYCVFSKQFRDQFQSRCCQNLHENARNKVANNEYGAISEHRGSSFNNEAHNCAPESEKVNGNKNGVVINNPMERQAPETGILPLICQRRRSSQPEETAL